MTVLLPLLLALAVQDIAPTEPDREAPIPAKLVAEAAKEDPPTVSIRTEGNGDRVEEYRQNGRIYMVKVTPSRGPAYYLMDTDGNGKLNRDDRDPRVSPVHWTIYEWD
jgi:hypothetical protein